VLARAEHVRTVRRDLATDVAAGVVTIDGVFQQAAADPVVADIKALTILQVTPTLGKIAARRLLAAMGLTESVRLGQLDAQTRDQLSEHVR
jgi:hypothetical protein